MASLAFPFLTPQIWDHVPIEDSRAARLADRHYSRGTVGADGLVGPGQRFLLYREDDIGAAVWSICRARDPSGVMRVRNTIFRNESGMISSELVIHATSICADIWVRRYKQLPSEPFTTEIDIEATKSRRSKRALPGRCYQMAGWTFIGIFDPKHGRAVKAIYKAPTPWSQAKCTWEYGPDRMTG